MKTRQPAEMLERVERWPADAQNELAEIARDIEENLSNGDYEQTPEEQAGIERGLQAADEGRFATDRRAGRRRARKAPRRVKVVYTEPALADLDEITAWLKQNYPGLGRAVERRLGIRFGTPPPPCALRAVGKESRSGLPFFRAVFGVEVIGPFRVGRLREIGAGHNANEPLHVAVERIKRLLGDGLISTFRRLRRSHAAGDRCARRHIDRSL
jgi:predicted transcriptional regulator